jgi:hypothetical protein
MAMKIGTIMLVGAIAAAVALPAAAGAAGADRHAAPRGLVAPAVRAAKGTRPAPKPKAPAVSRQHRTPATGLVILPYVGAPSIVTLYPNLSGVENCASYTGCTADEFCIVWGVGCERLAMPPMPPAAVEEVRAP